jgi:hypothetical protein
MDGAIIGPPPEDLGESLSMVKRSRDYLNPFYAHSSYNLCRFSSVYFTDNGYKYLSWILFAGQTISVHGNNT